MTTKDNAANRGTERYDVAIIGAGILGLMNASQLARRGLQVVVIDHLKAKKSYKVGESLLVFGNMFLRTVGGLAKFCRESSFDKDNLWFTYGMEGAEDFHGKTEWSLELKVPRRIRERFDTPERFETTAHDVHIVRPEAEAAMLENLRGTPGVTVIDTGLVRDVMLGAGETEPHTVEWQDANSKQSHRLQARWVLDCSGRNRLLARRFGHAAEGRELKDGFQTTAHWAQLEGISAEQFRSWAHHFDDGDIMDRHKSTLHLWGKGFWIWVIPLQGGRISVGVTFDQRLDVPGKPQEQFWSFIRRFPVLDRVLDPDKLLEFRTYRDVQYWTDTFVHRKRYAMVGDAASIIDAYYSQGMSLAFVTSWHIANIMQRDVRDGRLDVEYIDRVNRYTRQDWQILRNMVKYKYTDAIADSRFFILSHILDQVIFTGLLQERHWLGLWLFETQGYTDRETEWHRETRKRLERSLFYSAAGYLGRPLSPEQVGRLQELGQRGLAERAQWRVHNGVELPPIRALVRFPSYPVAIEKLKKPTRFMDVSPLRLSIAEMDRAGFTGSERNLPTVMRFLSPIILAKFGAAYRADARETAALQRKQGGSRKAGRKFRGHAGAA